MPETAGDMRIIWSGVALSPSLIINPESISGSIQSGSSGPIPLAVFARLLNLPEAI
jgi:hypothetical protein